MSNCGMGLTALPNSQFVSRRFAISVTVVEQA